MLEIFQKMEQARTAFDDSYENVNSVEDLQKLEASEEVIVYKS